MINLEYIWILIHFSKILDKWWKHTLKCSAELSPIEEQAKQTKHKLSTSEFYS